MHGCGRGFRVRFKGQIFTTEPPLLYIARAERPACTLYLPWGLIRTLSTTTVHQGWGTSHVR